MKLLVKLLTIPLDTLSMAVLKMHHYPALMDYMKFENKRTVALRITQAVLKDKRPLDKIKTVDRLISFINPLLADDKDAAKEEPYEFTEGQNLVSQLPHLVFHHQNVENCNDIYYELLNKFKRVFVKGGNARMKFTIPSMCFALIKLSGHINTKVSNPDAETPMHMFASGQASQEPASEGEEEEA